jgi:hypothetical protein
VSVVCWFGECSLWSAIFPPRPPPLVTGPGSGASQLLHRCPTLSKTYVWTLRLVAFAHRPALAAGVSEGLPVLVHEVPGRAGVYDYAGSKIAFRYKDDGGNLMRIFEAQNPARLYPV